MIVEQATGYKPVLVERLFSELGREKVLVLDLGCGTCSNFVAALKRHPNICYSGVEQDAGLLAQAQAAIGHLPNVQLHEAFGEAFQGRGYDLVMSLSVLEHVKRIDDFLAASVQATKPGGRLLHRYDLGHALTPSTLGERLRVAVARRAPALVPAARFTTYPNLDAILQRLGSLGVAELVVSQSQLPSLKKSLNLVDDSAAAGRALRAQIIELDERLWRHLDPQLSTPEARDPLFPTITISGYRVVASRPS